MIAGQAGTFTITALDTLGNVMMTGYTGTVQISCTDPQAVLPSDGTYYLVVTDYSSRGGVNGTYRLHVQPQKPRAPSVSAARPNRGAP